ncbi:MAG: putative Ig domain-containing protein, partial [Planctomycetota bacterium]
MNRNKASWRTPPRALLAALFLIPLLWCPVHAGDHQFIRADVTGEGARNLLDVTFLLEYLFNGGLTPQCLDACDANDDGSVNIGDTVYMLYFLFLSGPPPQPPSDMCGPDPTADNLGCAFVASCPPAPSLPPEITTTPLLTTLEAALYSYDVDAIDSPGDALTYALTVAPSGASIDAVSGLIEWTPTANQVGDHDFTVEVTDDDVPPLSDTQSFIVTVTDVNQPPLVDSTPITDATELQPYLYTVTTTDPDGDQIILELTAGPAGMVLTPLPGPGDPSAELSWTPQSDQIGPHVVTLTVTDNGSPPMISDQIFTIVVADVNFPPTISSFPPLTASQGTLYEYDLVGMDPDPGDVLDFEIDMGPAGMLLTTTSATTATLSWTPIGSQLGGQQIRIRATDLGFLATVQTFTVFVSPPPAAPTIQSTPVTTATELQLYNYDVDATDPLNDPLTYGLAVAPAGATIDSVTGLISWIPQADQTGSNAFTVTATDNEVPPRSDMQSFTVIVDDVNQQPVITTTAPARAVEGMLFEYDVDAADPDPLDTLQFALDAAPAGASINATSGLIQWTPTAAQVAAPQDFTVRVTDNGSPTLSDTQAFSVSVNDVNQAPTITSTAVTTATEATRYTYDVDATDPDPLDDLLYSFDDAPAGAMINSLSGLIEWTPTAQQSAIEQSFTVRVTDNGLPARSDTQMFVVDVLDINQPPTFTTTPTTTAVENSLFSYDVNADDPDPLDTVLYFLDNAPTGASINAVTGLVQWIPAASQVALPQAFTVRATDDGAPPQSVTQDFMVTVTDINQPPTIDSAAPTTATEDSLYTYAVSATDPDPTDTLTYVLDVAPAGADIDATTGLIEWTPTALQVATPQDFTVTVTDSGSPTGSDTQTFTVVVTDINQAPEFATTPVTTATEESVYSYMAGANDPDPTDTLTYALDVAPAGAEINMATGLIQWTPTALQVALPQEFTVRVTDNGSPALSDTQQFAVDVTDINQSPVFNSTPVTTATEESPYSYMANATDPDPTDVLTYTLDVAPTGAGINSTTGLIEWTPTALQVVAPQDFTVRVTDNGSPPLSDTQDFIVVVTDINQPPMINSAATVLATVGTLYEYLVLATDPDRSDTLTFELTTKPAGADIDANTGLLSWTPTLGQVGNQSFVVEVSDDGMPAQTVTQAFVVAVAPPPNVAPTITSIAPTTATISVQLNYAVVVDDPDVGESFTFDLTGAPVGAAIGPTGIFTWTPTADDIGSHSFSVDVMDAGGLSDSQALTIEVCYRINCGEFGTVYQDTQLRQWATDFGFNNAGEEFDAGPVAITNSDDDFLYRTERFTFGSSFRYDLPVPALPGDYAVRLHFAETAFTSAGQRVFDFTVEECAVANGYDIIANAGDSHLLIIDETQTIVADGTLRIEFLSGAANHPKVSAIEVCRGTIVNTAPAITSTPPLTAIDGNAYSYDAVTSDANCGDVLTLTLPVAPTGVTFDAGTGAISWVPDQQIGLHDFELHVSDLAGLTDTQSFQVEVLPPTPQAPTITSTPPLSATVDLPLQYMVTAEDINALDTLTFLLPTGPDGASIDPVTGLLEWTPTAAQIGDQSFTVRVEDDGLLFDEQSFTLPTCYRINCGETATPYVDSAANTWSTDSYFSPVPGRIFNAPQNVTGTSDPVLYRSERFEFLPDDFFYAVPTAAAPTRYALRLLFSETFWTAPGQRVFDVTIEGALALPAYDIHVAGGNQSFVAVDETFEVTVADGTLDLEFLHGLADHPKLGGIELCLSTQPNTNPAITSAAPTEATVDVALQYAVIVTDPDLGDTLNFALTTTTAGATLDPMTGAFDWTPTAAQLGLHNFTIDVTDAFGATDQQTLSINVVPGTNPPSITSTPPTTGVVGVAYSYIATATDADTADVLTFFLDESPSGMTMTVIPPLSAASVQLDWLPGAAQVADVTLRVQDLTGQEDVQSFQINVMEPNVAPVITSTAPTAATAGATFEYAVTATDAGPVTYSFDTAPMGAMIDDMTGLISWSPDGLDVGSHDFTVRATDAGMLFDTQDFTIEVSYRINCGELATPYIDGAGNTWTIDQGFNSGDTLTNTANPITGTLEPLLLSTQRRATTGLLGYSLEIPPGTYLVRLHFAELFDALVGERIFNVSIDGSSVLSDYDIVEEVGTFAASVEEFLVELAAGPLQVNWTGAAIPGAVVNAVEVLPAVPLDLNPVITSVPPTIALQDATYTYSVQAIDPNVGDTLTFDLVFPPVGMVIDASSGILTWVPDISQLGDHEVTVRVTDSTARSATQVYTVNVQASALNQAPVITSTAPIGATIGITFFYVVQVNDPNAGDSATFSITAGTGAIIDSNGVFSWTPTSSE